MYVAIFLGPFARGPRDDRALIDYSLRQAVEAAEAGFATISFGEQHFNNYEPYCNPFLMGAQLAGKLKDSYFATTVVPLPYHNPIRLAEDINVLDQLLGGKLIVGMSAGRVGFSPDFENFGLDPKEQRAIFAEKFAALETLWAHDPAKGPLSLDGRWVKGGVHGRVMPISYRAPKPLVAIGSNTEATVRKAGVDGHVMFLGPCSIAEAAQKYATYRAGLDEGGWDDAYKAHHIAHSMVHHQTVVADTDDEAWAIVEARMAFNPMMDRSGDPRTLRQMWDDGISGKAGLTEQEAKNSHAALGWYMVGSPDTLVDLFHQHADAGIEQVHTRFNAGMWAPEFWDRSFRLFVDEVMPRIDAKSFAPPQGDAIQQAVREGPLPPMPGPGVGQVATADMAPAKA
ncbi:LLM class flavin-dependent oxidoreductase [Novosphingobium sp. BL-52-GroH]|uniref:LLM class flavin-dependent oxidoreductase n=1 Tax=Novosphingobium sp. BL-52-GroH TaxID=3349877 RepID=UPI00384E82BB